MNVTIFVTSRKSHPSRGAWIEMPIPDELTQILLVAPLAGCVD